MGNRPHTETGLAGRAIAGNAPKMPKGLSPEVVADRVLAAIVGTDLQVASTDFS